MAFSFTSMMVKKLPQIAAFVISKGEQCPTAACSKHFGYNSTTSFELWIRELNKAGFDLLRIKNGVVCAQPGCAEELPHWFVPNGAPGRYDALEPAFETPVAVAAKPAKPAKPTSAAMIVDTSPGLSGRPSVARKLLNLADQQADTELQGILVDVALDQLK